MWRKMLSRSRTFFCSVVVLGGEKCMHWKAFPAQNFNAKPLTRQDKSQTYPKSLPPTAHRVPRPLLHSSVFAQQNKQLYKRASSLSSSQQGKEREKCSTCEFYSSSTWNQSPDYHVQFKPLRISLVSFLYTPELARCRIAIVSLL